MIAYLQKFLAPVACQLDILDSSWRPYKALVWYGHAFGWCCLIVVAALITRPSFADEISAPVSDVDHLPDFDRDGVADQFDLDQDNDGILNRDEGYISYADLSGYPAASFVLLSDGVETADELSLNQTAGSVFRYPLLNSRGTPAVDFVGTVVHTNTRVDWATQQQLPKLKHLSAGQTRVRWQFMRFGTDEQRVVDIDLTVGDLDGNRSESVTIDTTDIAGYSVSLDTNLQIDDTVAGKLIFTAQGMSDNTENDAVVLHLRSVSELEIIYNSSSNVNVLPGLDNDAAGFRHNFTAGELERYIPAPVVRDTDSDGYPDHRDLDSNNDGLPDVDISFDSNRDGMVDGSVDSSGVPSKNEVPVAEETVAEEPVDDAIIDSAVVDQPVEPLPVEVVPTPLSPASATLNIISDLDRDSIADSVEGLGDADGDGVPNQYDLDSDNDGLADLIEAGAIDADHNGVIDDPPDAPVKTYTTVVPDFDNDGLPDFLDIDSDQDGSFDLVEAGGVDLDSNGTIDDLIDQNGDGWDDRFLLQVLLLPDSDNDGNPDTLDNDGSALDPVVLEDFQQISEASEHIVTGSGSAGCVLSADARAIDPLLWVLLLVLQFYYVKRHVVSHRRRATHVPTP